MSTAKLLRDTADRLRASAAFGSAAASATPATACLLPSSGFGEVTATPAFPFDALGAGVVLHKTTLLIVDMDSIVLECARVMQWCASGALTTHHSADSAAAFTAGAVGQEKESASLSQACAVVPSLATLLWCFLRRLRDLILKHKLSAELVLGRCDTAFATLAEVSRSLLQPNEACGTAGIPVAPSAPAQMAPSSLPSQSARSPRPRAGTGAGPALDASIQSVEEAAVWLQVYQSIIAFFSTCGADVLEVTSLYVTDWPGCTGVMARLHSLNGTIRVINQNVLPLVCSSDPRVYFAAASGDALVSLWSHCCSSDVEQLCGRPLPATLRLVPGTSQRGSGEPDAPPLAVSGLDADRTLLIRHAASTARRFQLQSAAYLPVLYTLLALRDAHYSSTDAEALSCSSSSFTTPLSDAAPFAHSAVARAAELVNHYRGTLHVDLIGHWVMECDVALTKAKNHGAAAVQGLPSQRVPPDLSRPLWRAQVLLQEVTAGKGPTQLQLRPVWVGKAWKYTGPPPLCCHAGFLASLKGVKSGSGILPLCHRKDTLVSATVRAGGEGGGGSGRITTVTASQLQSVPSPWPLPPALVHACFSPLRRQATHAAHVLFVEEKAFKDERDKTADLAVHVTAALRLTSPPLSCALADSAVTVLDATAAAVCADTSGNVVRADAASSAAAGPRKTSATDGDRSSTIDQPFSQRPASSPTTAATSPSPAACQHTFQTRVSLDAVRNDVAPAVQLTFVALTAVWRSGLWAEEDCLRFLVRYLEFLAEQSGEVAVARPLADAPPACLWPEQCSEMDASAQAAEHIHHLASGCSWAVCECEVAVWWHAVSCVAVLHSLTTSIHSCVVEMAAGPVANVSDATAATPQSDLGSVLDGCLPKALYGPADRLAFLSFLQRHHYLGQRCSHGSAQAAAANEDGGELDSIRNPEERPQKPGVVKQLPGLLRTLQCPVSLIGAVVSAHNIWQGLSAQMQ